MYLSRRSDQCANCPKCRRRTGSQNRRRPLVVAVSPGGSVAMSRDEIGMEAAHAKQLNSVVDKPPRPTVLVGGAETGTRIWPRRCCLSTFHPPIHSSPHQPPRPPLNVTTTDWPKRRPCTRRPFWCDSVRQQQRQVKSDLSIAARSSTQVTFPQCPGACHSVHGKEVACIGLDQRICNRIDVWKKTSETSTLRVNLKR
jgi:hypothetical protein